MSERDELIAGLKLSSASFVTALEGLAIAMGHFAVVWDDRVAPSVVDLLLWDMQATGELDPFRA